MTHSRSKEGLMLRNQLLWGVKFTRSRNGGAPILIGDFWAQERCGKHKSEPSRALLFKTRTKAREWCKKAMMQWREEAKHDDIIMNWRATPVRVREVVSVEE